MSSDDEQFKNGYVTQESSNIIISNDPDMWDDTEILQVFDEAVRTHKYNKKEINAKDAMLGLKDNPPKKFDKQTKRNPLVSKDDETDETGKDDKLKKLIEQEEKNIARESRSREFKGGVGIPGPWQTVNPAPTKPALEQFSGLPPPPSHGILHKDAETPSAHPSNQHVHFQFQQQQQLLQQQHQQNPQYSILHHQSEPYQHHQFHVHIDENLNSVTDIIPENADPEEYSEEYPDEKEGEEEEEGTMESGRYDASIKQLHHPRTSTNNTATAAASIPSGYRQGISQTLPVSYPYAIPPPQTQPQPPTYYSFPPMPGTGSTEAPSTDVAMAWQEEEQSALNELLWAWYQAGYCAAKYQNLLAAHRNNHNQHARK